MAPKNRSRVKTREPAAWTAALSDEGGSNPRADAALRILVRLLARQAAQEVFDRESRHGSDRLIPEDRP